MDRKILIVDDEKAIVDILKFNLEKEGFQTVEAYDGEEGYRKVFLENPDLILLDLMLPKMDGFEVCKKIRERLSTPIIMLTAREEEVDKVLGLELGADDYITKPFGISELMARVRAALRHKSLLTDNSGVESVIRIKDLTIDIAKHTVTKDGEEIHFTQNEFKCLVLLGRHAGKVLTYDFIMKNIWGPYSPSDNQILRVNMANIRRKLKENPAEPKYILTELGIGYRMLIE